MTLPTDLMVNAWTGAPGGNQGVFASQNQLISWALQQQVEPGKTLALAADEPPDLRDWSDPEVGWGLILPENEKIPPAARATPQDAPEPIQRLWAHRGQGPVFRYRTDLGTARLRRYDSNGAACDPRIADSGYGTGLQQIPLYLLIAASPDVIPWELQFTLNASWFTGRLALDAAGLDNYVTALIDNWSLSPARSTHPVVWSAVNGPRDITALMKKLIADPVADKLAADSETGPHFAEGRFSDAQATCQNLIEALKDRNPAFILTTSHGQTAPLDDKVRLAASLGLPVDSHGQTLDLDLLQREWEPRGAVWYAHACCGAGSIGRSQYAGVIPNGGSLDVLFNAISSLGNMTSPLPQRLMSCKNPLRAFIGQVEPTLDWTLRDPVSGQGLTKSLRRALYFGFFRKDPESVGMAFDNYFNEVGPLFMQVHFIQRDLRQGVFARVDDALKFQLAAMDRSHMVILGDPAAAIPALSTVAP
ncbi:hypothetical protein [Planctomicrobium piriforme]|uniref:Uncharacterized protein n=1 Tax=Planctomicrobium piriforme TaxID=1576369 RepID=A0A1I3JDA8_9PLAN|nr:hypothetical protein [Planctomicrobium piriforme]SFI58237.1 hypothetical protein SAMN05421753_110138 [Planctomicrobium piriforme]